MLRRKWIPVAILAATLTATLAVLLPRNATTSATAQVPANACSDDFGEVNLGAEFEGLGAKRFRQCDPPPEALANGVVPPPIRRNLVSHMYGSCKPEEGATGCTPPLEIQTWRACERNLSLYERYPSPDGDVVPYERTTVRGVPAAIFEDGSRIEVYTGDLTVVIFADNPNRAQRAARSLRGRIQGLAVRATQTLPPPASEALKGELVC